jgi:(E)-4-hydroxy-3-methylbut-2-enyl-diphosphate synthase
MRRKTREIKVGNISIGGNNPIVVQSMTKTKTSDIPSTVNQIKNLEKSGCEIVRVAVPDLVSAKAIKEIKKEINIPLIADIHFREDLAIEAIKYGADGIRINPGNMRKENLKNILNLAKEKNVCIRIGVNSGSIKKEYLKKYSSISSALVECACEYLNFFEKNKFYNTKISLKSTDIKETISAYEKISEKVDYPLHIGITEAGPLLSGSIKSAIGIGILLLKGIGDTIRVSLTEEPEIEVKVAFDILVSLNLRSGYNIISCPTCGRCSVNLREIVKDVENKIKNLPHPKKEIKIAIMGCEVNGPGEAKHADLGIACGKNTASLFKNGKILKKVKEEEATEILLKELKFLN